ncbi:hypothetical protein GGU10DRAFT_256595, partial [Lentinula aff. detonsa]
ALWIADFIETLPTEINAIWQKKTTGASVLFLINRYSLLLSLIFQTLLDLPGNQTEEQCDVTYNIVGVIQILAVATTNVLFALRVYSIYNKNRIILGTCSSLIISRLVIDILQQITFQASSSAGTQFQSFSACVLIVLDSNLYNQYVDDEKSLVPFLALVYDIYIFGLTIRKTIELGFEMKRHSQFSVAHVILQDGDLPNMLISRLMLNLRTFPPPEGHTLTTSQGAYLSSLHFASNQILGNIGAPLDGGSFNED